ncbi:hypothetical protein TNCT_241731 [Trichonephila clavata]|uniref:Uncharacterized protein n=1 Tax=Trichonephila clavata TaxID=2740835 RepID=A0A8X6IJH4_TRICU|nr:hypothetical protein TNCT_241731 [Trichonephila clavata]
MWEQEYYFPSFLFIDCRQTRKRLCWGGYGYLCVTIIIYPRHLWNKLLILSDSKAVIRTIGFGEINIYRNIIDCREDSILNLLVRLRMEGGQFTFQWISGHCDITERNS